MSFQKGKKGLLNLTLLFVIPLLSGLFMLSGFYFTKLYVSLSQSGYNTGNDLFSLNGLNEFILSYAFFTGVGFFAIKFFYKKLGLLHTNIILLLGIVLFYLCSQVLSIFTIQQAWLNPILLTIIFGALALLMNPRSENKSKSNP